MVGQFGTFGTSLLSVDFAPLAGCNLAAQYFTVKGGTENAMVDNCSSLAVSDYRCHRLAEKRTSKGRAVKGNTLQFVTVFTVEVERGRAQEFIERFQKRARFIDKAKGFKGLFILQHTQESDKFQVVTFWENEQSFNAWVNSEEFRKAHAEGGVPTKATKFDTYRVVAK